jgi:hypothetical protein
MQELQQLALEEERLLEQAEEAAEAALDEAQREADEFNIKVPPAPRAARRPVSLSPPPPVPPPSPLTGRQGGQEGP